MEETAREANVKRAEELLAKVNRPGMDRLINYLRKSDFYTAPASTRFHLSTKGGLLQHSLNVYDALIGRMREATAEDGSRMYEYGVSGKTIVQVKEETVILTTLLHDLCKTNFYTIEQRWRKDKNNRWESYDVYGINDKSPYGHGEKSAMMVSEFIHLTQEELFAIRWHMGMSTGQNDIQTYNQACDKFPLVHLLHTADQEASHYMEGTDDNLQMFRPEVKPEVTEADMEAWADAAPLG